MRALVGRALAAVGAVGLAVAVAAGTGVGAASAATATTAHVTAAHVQHSSTATANDWWIH